MVTALDQTLAFHCAPTLDGLKPANLIAYAKEKSLFLAPNIGQTQEALACKGLKLEKLYSCEKRELALFYNEKMLTLHLKQPHVWGFLFFHGYPMYKNLDDIIAHLKKRVKAEGGFPHEVGVFLGYPIEDVMGFIRHKGQNCKACGYWKVYGDLKHAQSQFERFNQSRDMFLSELEKGRSIAQILMAS